MALRIPSTGLQNGVSNSFGSQNGVSNGFSSQNGSSNGFSSQNESFNAPQNGPQLHFIYGPMFSGKTTTLLRLTRNLDSFIVVRPTCDNRFGEDNILRCHPSVKPILTPKNLSQQSNGSNPSMNRPLPPSGNTSSLRQTHSTMLNLGSSNPTQNSMGSTQNPKFTTGSSTFINMDSLFKNQSKTDGSLPKGLFLTDSLLRTDSRPLPRTGSKNGLFRTDSNSVSNTSTSNERPHVPRQSIPEGEEEEENVRFFVNGKLVGEAPMPPTNNLSATTSAFSATSSSANNMPTSSRMPESAMGSSLKMQKTMSLRSDVSMGARDSMTGQQDSMRDVTMDERVSDRMSITGADIPEANDLQADGQESGHVLEKFESLLHLRENIKKRNLASLSTNRKRSLATSAESAADVTDVMYLDDDDMGSNPAGSTKRRKVGQDTASSDIFQVQEAAFSSAPGTSSDIFQVQETRFSSAPGTFFQTEESVSNGTSFQTGGSSLSESAVKTIFIDEIHLFPDWKEQLDSLKIADNLPGVKHIVIVGLHLGFVSILPPARKLIQDTTVKYLRVDNFCVYCLEEEYRRKPELADVKGVNEINFLMSLPRAVISVCRYAFTFEDRVGGSEKYTSLCRKHYAEYHARTLTSEKFPIDFPSWERKGMGKGIGGSGGGLGGPNEIIPFTDHSTCFAEWDALESACELRRHRNWQSMLVELKE